MFTGIIEALGRVLEFDGANLAIAPLAALGANPIQIGESISVNGCCLTVVRVSPSEPSGALPPAHITGEPSALGFEFNLSPETVSRTTLGSFKLGAAVNLERAMRADGRFGGHLVQGHVDATGLVVSITPIDGATIFRFRAPEVAAKYLIDKGSVAVDGISLTVVTPEGSEFDTWIIPHTLANTNLGGLGVGDTVNLEFDVMAKYAERLLRS